MAASSDRRGICPSGCGLPASAGNGERAAFGVGGTCAGLACRSDGCLRRTSGTAGCACGANAAERTADVPAGAHAKHAGWRPETAFPSHSRSAGDFFVAADAFCAVCLSGPTEKEAGAKPGRTFGRGCARVYLCQLPLCAALAAACRSGAGKCAVRKLFGENRNDFGT